MMKVPEMDDDAELADEVGPIESPETAAHEHPAPRRGRVALACQRCKRRKQRVRLRDPGHFPWIRRASAN